MTEGIAEQELNLPLGLDVTKISVMPERELNETHDHSDVSTIRVSEKNVAVPSHPCTETDTLKQIHRH